MAVSEFLDGADLALIHAGTSVVELFELAEAGISVIGRGVYGLGFMSVIEGDHGRAGTTREDTETYGREEGEWHLFDHCAVLLYGQALKLRVSDRQVLGRVPP